MKVFQVILNFVTTFLIVGGGGIGIAASATGGAPLNNMCILAIIATAAVAAGKETRSFIGLPPLSNGNYDALKQFVDTSNKQKEEEKTNEKDH